MKFSIIIPAYCAERTLKRCLKSIQQQTFADYEAIIINDGSTDATGEIAKAFALADDRFRYIEQENQGVSATRNHGLRCARGTYVVFLDSDDQYHPDYLQAFHSAMEAHPDCDQFWCCYETVNSQGVGCGSNAVPDAGELLFRDRKEIMDLHDKVLDAPLWNKAFRRQLLEQARIEMDKSLSLGEDILFNFAYMDVCDTRIVLINQPLYLYTKASDGSLDSKYRPDLEQIYDRLLTAMLSYLQKWQVSADQMARYYTSAFFHYERVLHNTLRPECTMGPAQKRRYNSMLIRSKKFQEALSLASHGPHPLYRLAYRAGSWTMVACLNRLLRAKQILTRRNKGNTI